MARVRWIDKVEMAEEDACRSIGKVEARPGFSFG